MSDQVVDEVAQVVDRGGEPDDVLRAAVALLASSPEIAWAGVAFLEGGELVLGPQAGTPDEARRVRVPISYGDDAVGELWVDGPADRAVLDRVAALVSAHVLIGWDTGGEAWEP